jgi:predicted alpha/beta hydrolase
MRELTIAARDGLPLAATLYPAAKSGESRGERVALISSATAVPRGFYDRFARYLSDNGWSVLTYDYRAVGGSRREPARRSPVRMREWADLDYAGVLDWVATSYPDAVVKVIGHSFGGQVAGITDNGGLIGGVLAVASHSGYWRLFRAPERYRVAIAFCYLAPLIAHSLGKLPGRLVGGQEDLPKGVVLDWTRWCRSPRYLFDDESFASAANAARFSAPICAFRASDDDWGTAAAVEALLAEYPAAPRYHWEIRPPDAGLKRLGHFGFFRSSAAALWPHALAWLDDGTLPPAAHPVT